MQQSVLEMAKDLVNALIQADQLTPDTMDEALQNIFASLLALQGREERVAAGTSPVIGYPAVSKQLSSRHLRQHDLNARSYRAKYNIPQTLPLAARATTARRRKAVQETRPWEKTPRYLATQAGTAAVATESAAAKR